MAGIKIVDLPALGRDLIATDLLELSLAGGTGSRKITGQEIMNASKLSVGNTPIINGAVGQVLFQGTGDVLQQSEDFAFDAVNSRVLLGKASNNTAQLLFQYPRISSLNGVLWADNLNNPYGYLALDRWSGEMRMFTSSSYFPTFYSSNAERLRIATTGNVLIGTTTDAGFKFDVNGTARVSGRFTIGSDIIPSGVGSSVVLAAHIAAGNILDLSYYTGSQNALSTTKNVVYSAITFNPNGGTAVFNQLNFAPTINQTGGANGITRGLYVNPTLTAAADFRAIETTVGNVLLGTTSGNVGIGTSSPTNRLEVNGSSRFATTINVGGNGGTGGSLSAGFIVQDNGNGYGSSFVHCQAARLTLFANPQSFAIGGFEPTSSGLVSSDAIAFMNASTTRMKIPTTGNVLINTTTDAGYRLDVNGTGRIQGQLNLGNASTDGFLYSSPSVAMRFGGGQTTNTFIFTQINSGRFQASGTTEQAHVLMTVGQAESSGQENRGSVIRHTGTVSTSNGNAIFSNFQTNTVINTTGGTTTYRGFYHNPTLTATTGVTHFAIHTTAGRVRFEGLPTSPTGLNAGDIYNDGGTLKIV